MKKNSTYYYYYNLNYPFDVHLKTSQMCEHQYGDNMNLYVY